MSADRTGPPQHNRTIVERVLLEEALELHPQQPTVAELSLRIILNPDDSREVETAAQAIKSLKEVGLFCDRDDDIVVPTPACLRAGELLI
jgi:hypothetical protein